MRANPGDWLVVKGTVVGSPDQRGRILDVRGADGAPPYLVRWLPDGRVSLVFPAADGRVVSAAEQRRTTEEEWRRLRSLQKVIIEG